jgi:Ca-activated chloride channel family protein
VAEITSLGLAYSLLTKYTSFIAVHEIVRRSDGPADHVDQRLPLPAGVSDRAIGVTNGPEPDLVSLAAMLVASFACVRLFRRHRRHSRAAL